MKYISLLFFIFIISCTSQNIFVARNLANLNSYDGTIKSNLNPLRNIEDVNKNSEPEEFVRLTNARILIADYDLIRKDFIFLRNKSNEEIDKWLLDNTAYISKKQANQSVVNTDIPISDEVITAYRPPRYGRAIVFEVDNPDSQTIEGLIDVKGTGSLDPGHGSHSDGLATLGEVVREYIYERAMREIVKDSGLKNKVVGSYAVVDPGFDVKHANGATSPAGFYLRQAHGRNKREWLPSGIRVKVQNVLRSYGIDPKSNIQGTRENHIFDFGHYIVRDDLDNLDKSKSLPFHLWGYNKDLEIDAPPGRDFSKLDWPWIWSHELADNWRKGNANRDDVWRHFINLTQPFIDKIRNPTCHEILNGFH